MKFKLKEMAKQNNGITLIALVITIIVLLILAGVTISTLTGENGILNQAINAKEKTEDATAEEKARIALLNWQIYKNDGNATLENYLKENFDSVVNNENGTYTVTLDGYEIIVDKDGNLVVEEALTDIFVTLYTDGTLVFSNDNTTITGKTVQSSYGNIREKKFDGNTTIPWFNEKGSIVTVSFINKVVPTNIDYWFKDCENLTAIENIKNLVTSNVTSMSSVFYGCSSLTSLDLSDFYTSNVTDMGQMFYGCSSLTSLELSYFDTSKVTNMYNMFSNCSSLTSLDLTTFNTSNVTNMGQMFLNCNNIKVIYGTKGKWTTEKVTSNSNMFSNCGTNRITFKAYVVDNIVTGFVIEKGKGWRVFETVISRFNDNYRASSVDVIELDPNKTYKITMSDSNYYFGIKAVDGFYTKVETYDSGWLAPGSKIINGMGWISLNFKYQNEGTTVVTDSMVDEIMKGLTIEIVQ